MTNLTENTQLHHYTTASGLRSILESGELRFSTFNKMNDPREAKRWGFSFHSAGVLSTQPDLGNKIDLALNSLRDYIHLGCFTIDDEETESHPKLMTSRGCSHPRMWAQYASHCGACLVFNFSELQRVVKATANKLDALCHHGRVSYIDKPEPFKEPFMVELTEESERDPDLNASQYIHQHYRTLFFEKAQDWATECFSFPPNVLACGC